MEGAYYQAYIGTNSVRGSKGIYSIRVDESTLKPESVATTEFYNAGSLALSRDESLLYGAVEGMTFNGQADGGVVGYRTNSDGTLTKINGQRSHGQRTCCVALGNSDRNVYVCNFYRGSLSIFDMEEDGSICPARLVIDPPQDSEVKALHCVGSVGGNYIGVISLAECALVVYRADDGKRVTHFSFPGKPFPRYFETSGKYIYAMMQSPDDIYVFENLLEEEGDIRLLQKISLMGDDYQGSIATSTIRATSDGKLLLAANRPSNTITFFEIADNGMLERTAIEVLDGQIPRDFHISSDGQIVVSAMQGSNEVCVNRIDRERARFTGETAKIGIPSPASVVVGGRKR